MSAEFSPFLQLAIELAIILLAAKAAGYLSARLGQPSVLGEILVGILLGPSLLDIAHLPFVDSTSLADTIHELGELGVLLLMFIAGLELHLGELTRNTRVSALAGALGVLLPVGFGWGLGLMFGMEGEAAAFLGITLGATSVSISAQTLMELKVLRSRVGLGLLGAAVFDDVLVILLLSGFMAIVEGGTSIAGLLLILGRMVLFLGLSVAFGFWVLPWLTKVTARLPISQGMLSLALIVMLVFGVAAEALGGMAAITGAFLAGLAFARTHEKERMEAGIHALAYGLFVPIFFVSIGLSVNLRHLELSALWLTLAVILTALITKFIGSGFGARLGGLPWRESWQLGAGMISRGEVGLIVANVGIVAGLVSQDEFSAIIGMILVSTLVTPPLLRILFRRPSNTPSRTEEPEQPDRKKEIA
ncbi:MAG: cation:proton antiporter [Chloroflexi bacterium]|nr:cation:proton antiporter [Chloroflexota bacterium]